MTDVRGAEGRGYGLGTSYEEREEKETKNDPTSVAEQKKNWFGLGWLGLVVVALLLKREDDRAAQAHLDRL